MVHTPEQTILILGGIDHVDKSDPADVEMLQLKANALKMIISDSWGQLAVGTSAVAAASGDPVDLTNEADLSLRGIFANKYWAYLATGNNLRRTMCLALETVFSLEEGFPPSRAVTDAMKGIDRSGGVIAVDMFGKLGAHRRGGIMTTAQMSTSIHGPEIRQV